MERNQPNKKNITGDDNRFPGYPHYPESDDLTRNADKIDADPDRLSNKGTPGIQPPEEVKSALNTNELAAADSGETDEDLIIVPGTEADVTEEDLKNLGDPDRDQDEGEDELLESMDAGFSHTGDDLDVPGSELDDENELRGSEDEENNYYSLGGDKD